MTLEQITPQQNDKQEEFNDAEKDILKIVGEIQKCTGIINGLNGFIKNSNDQEKILHWKKMISDEEKRIEIFKKDKLKLQEFNDLIKKHDGDVLLAATTQDAENYKKQLANRETHNATVINIFDKEGGLSRVQRRMDDYRENNGNQ